MNGGVGMELVRRQGSGDNKLWSTQVMMENPGLVRSLHEEYIDAGAQIITTNTYGSGRPRMDEMGVGDRFEEMCCLGGQLAVEARERSGKDVLIAGSLPPYNGSYRPDLVLPADQLRALYQEQAELLAPYVDFFICETMSSAEEGSTAARAASGFGKPVCVAWTLKDDASCLLRSGETIEEAVSRLEDIEISGHFANCCSPETVTVAMSELVELPGFAGGYANGFKGIPDNWTVSEVGLDCLGQREDLDPASYSLYARKWLEAGAKVVGGCCNIGPEHIAHIRDTVLSDFS